VTNVLREDEPGVPFDPERALQNAPQREGSFFKVPPVLDQGSGA
jgi:aspartyl/glutamyl-tRNA(Asn/Gln) amidotransferase C subunit